jgi:hypothetical protein
MKKISSLRLVIGFIVAFLTASFSEAALFSLSGNHRFGANLFDNLDAKKGLNLGPHYDENNSETSAFLEHRLLLRPDVLIDERFSLHSELSLLTQNGSSTEVSFNSSQSPNQTNGGSGFDPTATQILSVRHAYLKWVSDLGVFKAGRMPKGWGLGLLFDEGSKPEDEASTIVDRVGFEGQLGSLVLNAGFEKRKEGYLYTNIDDEDVYEGSVKYENEGSGVAIGLLFGRHIRSAFTALTHNSSNDYSFYAKKEWELSSIAAEFASNSYDKQAQVYGALTQYRYHPGNWEFEVDGVFSSHSGDQSFLVHPNYRPFLILYKQVQGSYVGKNENSKRFGNGIGLDPASDLDNSEKGALVGRLGAFYSFAQKKYRLGLVGGYAKLISSNVNGDSLGFETDLHFEQKWYENFKTSLIAGAFIPGKAFASERKESFGVQFRTYLNF